MATYETTEKILDKQRVTAETDAKDPGELVDADLPNLSTGRLTELMNSGQLTRFGIGAAKRPARRR